MTTNFTNSTQQLSWVCLWDYNLTLNMYHFSSLKIRHLQLTTRELVVDITSNISKRKLDALHQNVPSSVLTASMMVRLLYTLLVPSSGMMLMFIFSFPVTFSPSLYQTIVGSGRPSTLHTNVTFSDAEAFTSCDCPLGRNSGVTEN